MKKWMLMSLVGVLLSTGCSTTSMKGTPFYTGEYAQNEGLAANRIYVWPLVYYRDPSLSILWPIMEFSPELQAVRPLYSAYDLDTDHPVYNVVWPLGRFDASNKNYRFFPVYWGEDYFNIVPLYWQEGDPWSGTGHNALFPLWIWKSRPDGTSLDVFWPLYARHRYASWNGWHLWPLYSIKQTSDSTSRYVLWPLIHSYTNASSAGSWAIPLYSYVKKEDRTTFSSLPYSFSHAREAEDKSWDLAIPLWYRSWTDSRSSWKLLPALSWGQGGTDWSDRWYLLGMARRAQHEESLYHHVLPFYYYGSGPEGRRLYTLPWWWKERPDGSGFHAVIPLYYRGYSEFHSSFYSIPWLHVSYADGSGWDTTFPLYYRGYSTNSASFYSIVWSSKKYSEDTGWHTTIPLYYRSYAPDASSFYSLPWMSETHPDGTSWQASFPFYYGARTPDGSVLITPLYARKRHSDGSTAWRCYIPIVYVNDDYDAHFMTLLGGRWRLGEQEKWLALPLLSGGSKDEVEGKNIYLGGLAAQWWNQTGSSHYVLPLYYRAPQAGRFISLPYATWPDGYRQNHVILPALSGWYTEEDQTRALLLAGLAGYRTGGLDPYHYVFPLYYSAPADGKFYSLPYASWRTGDLQHHLVLPLLSGWSSGPDRYSTYLALGLIGFRNGGPYSYNYVFPLYYASADQRSFVSPLYATWSTGLNQHHTIPLLLSGMSTTPEGTDYLLLGGLAGWRQGAGQTEASHLLPFYMWKRDAYTYSVIYGRNAQKSYFATPLAGRYEPGSGQSGSWVIPFYWYRRSLSTGGVKGYYFPLGYYRKNNEHTNHGILGVYDYETWTRTGEGRIGTTGNVQQMTVKSKRLHYLLSLGRVREDWAYDADSATDDAPLISYRKQQTLFPFWTSNTRDDPVSGEYLKTSSLLGILYDTRHEKKTLETEDHDYVRKRILWRLYHYEKLNGDVSKDIFPAITVDSYKNGYYKFSVFWRLFRYEKDPESQRTRLDLLFLPLKR